MSRLADRFTRGGAKVSSGMCGKLLNNRLTMPEP